MAIEIKVPSPGEAITEVEIGTWLIEDGAVVEMDDELVEINSDKATLTIAAEDDGQVKILKEEGDVVQVGDVIATIDTSVAPADKPAEEKKEEASAKEEVAAPQVVSADSHAAGHPSVSAEKMMKEKGISKENVVGTGRGGRITKTDVVEHLKSAPAEKVAANGNGASKQPAVQQPMTGDRTEERKKMPLLRRKIAERLVSVKNETAMLTTFNEVDMYEIMELRKKYKEKFKEQNGVSLGFMSFFTKAVTESLKLFPKVNAMIDGEEMIFHNYCDVGIAVSTPRGLVVPVLRNAEQMSLAQIEAQIRDYAIRARDGKLAIDEMTGGTFTITNGGVFGSMLSTPILNPPQSAILGMHNIVQRPVAINGEVKIRPIMYVALSYDHRIIDGKESVSFLYKVKEFLEDPARLLIGI